MIKEDLVSMFLEADVESCSGDGIIKIEMNLVIRCLCSL